MDVIGLWVSHQHKHKFQTLVFNIDGDRYNAFSILDGKLKHTSNAPVYSIKGIFEKLDDWSDFNDIARMKKKQVIRRIFSPDPSNVNDCLRAKK